MGRYYDQLSLAERCEIYRLHAGGISLRSIGRALGRSAATISREIRRNSGVTVGYKVEWAMIRARARRKRKLYRLECSSALREKTFDLLAMGWSPELIAGRLEREYGKTVISHESIYRYIYWRAASHAEPLHRFLPRAKCYRGWRKRTGSGRFKGDRASVHDRPQAVEDRSEEGHWEADLMLFRQTGQSVLVAVERKSRLLLALPRPGKSAAAVADGLETLLAPLKKRQRRSITFDNGAEFSEYKRLQNKLRLKTWFCDNHSPWQKGSVENSIGRLRKYLPRKTTLADIGEEEFQDIILNYNMTPRKCLEFKTPAEIFFNQFNPCCT